MRLRLLPLVALLVGLALGSAPASAVRAQATDFSAPPAQAKEEAVAAPSPAIAPAPDEAAASDVHEDDAAPDDTTPDAVIILAEGGAGVELRDGQATPRLGDAPAPDDRVVYTDDGFRIADEAGGALVEVGLDRSPAGDDYAWIWSPRAWSMIDLGPELGLDVRGIAEAEAERLGRPRNATLAVRRVADASFAAAAGLYPGDYVVAVEGAPATPLRLRAAARALRAGSVVTLRVLEVSGPAADATTGTRAVRLDPDADLAAARVPAAWAVTVADAGRKAEAHFEGRRLRVRADGRAVHRDAFEGGADAVVRIEGVRIPTPSALAAEAARLGPLPTLAPGTLRGHLRVEDAARDGLRLFVLGDVVRATTATGARLDATRDGDTITVTDPATGTLRYDVHFDPDTGRFWWWSAPKGE